MSLKEPVLDRYVPYITMAKEHAPADDKLESKFEVSFRLVLVWTLSLNH